MPDEFFHVAPAGTLSPGQRPALFRSADLSVEGAPVFDSLFPAGVTYWGEAMLMSSKGAMVLGPEGLISLGVARTVGNGRELEVSELGFETMAATRNRVIELVFELVRRLEFPAEPSRFTSVFAYRTLDEARGYRATRRDAQTHEVWSLSCDEPEAVHAADSRWLNAQHDAVRSIYVARSYWSCEPYLLLAPPVPHNEALIPQAL